MDTVKILPRLARSTPASLQLKLERDFRVTSLETALGHLRLYRRIPDCRNLGKSGILETWLLTESLSLAVPRHLRIHKHIAPRRSRVNQFTGNL